MSTHHTYLIPVCSIEPCLKQWTITMNMGTVIYLESVPHAVASESIHTPSAHFTVLQTILK